MDDIASELRQLKDQAIEATAAGDRAFYESYLTANAIGVTPAGVFTKSQIVEAMASGKFKSEHVDHVKVHVLADDAGYVTYEATYRKPDGQTFTVFVSTIYQRTEAGWKGVFYQQTVLPNK